MRDTLTEAEFIDGEALGAPEDVCRSDWVVLKFGGTSVSSADNWATIARLVQNRLDEGLRPVIVHSALAGVSNRLEQALEQAALGVQGDHLSAISDQHLRLANELGVDGLPLIEESVAELDQLLAGVRLIREVSDRVRVRIMALGELMATRLGADYLRLAGLPVTWVDARDHLTSVSRGGGRRSRDFLSAKCDATHDPEFCAHLADAGEVILTQGFIARNEWGETVLLGRGGSDTSAAYFAAKLRARRLEIWTDVPGMFTADPRVVPSARLLLALHYDEAQELASAGSSVLHPRSISPLRDHLIPLFIRCTAAPEIAGTVVSNVTMESEPQVKGICLRNGLTLISMDGVGMWHEVGFLARAFSIFSELSVSVDLVSTSETNVTVSVDNTDGELPADTRRSLVGDLEKLCRVRVIDDCSAVSFVGRKIRTILPRLAPALSVFEEEKIHLISQAANDLNMSFVVDQGQGPKLVRKLHASIIRETGGSPVFGQSWEQLFQGRAPVAKTHDTWWMRKREQLLELGRKQLNSYVYDRETVREAARGLLGLQSVDRVLYAVKANFNAELLRVLAGEGIDFECVSPGEVEWVREVIPGIDVGRILFTPNFAPRDEYEWALAQGLHLTLDNLYPLEAWPEVFEGREILVRIDPGHGKGHHEHVKTAGLHSKFGIPMFEVDELQRRIEASGARVIGVHAHSGSGILDPDNWRTVAVKLVQVAERFPDVRSIDLGGGIGVPDKPGDAPFDLGKLDATLRDIRSSYPKYDLWLEPGRYLVSQAGVLLSRVTQVKGKGDMRYVGIGTGMNSLIRPALYGAYHEIVNLSKAHDAPTDTVTVVGPICETGDRIGSDRLMPAADENDVILIANAGAYGFVMSSQYNRRKVAEEIVI